MITLTADQHAFIGRMTEGDEYERHGFDLLVKRPDFDCFFDALAAAGLFAASRNPGPIPADEPGYYRLPYWSPLSYLEATAKRAGGNQDIALAEKVMNVLRDVSRWRDDQGNIRNNENTWYSFASIFGLVPTSVVSLPDVDLIALWLGTSFGRSRVGAAFAGGALNRFVESESPEDWSKACRILYHCTEIRWSDKERIGGEIGKKAQTAVDDFWLEKLIDSSATLLGAKVGKEAADVFLERLRHLFAGNYEGCHTHLLRPAVEDHPQNHDWDGPPNRLVEGLRNVLLGWVDQDSAGAKSFVEELLRDEAEIVRRIAIHVVNERFEALRPLVPLLITQEIFDRGHLHEAYGLLKAHFKHYTEDEKRSTLATLQAMPLEEERPDPESARRYMQRQWLSAIAGQGYQLADSSFNELMSDPTLGVLSSHPDFHFYIESRWGSGPSPYTVPELVSFAESATIVEKLNAFAPSKKWDAPTTESLSDAVVEAVSVAPRIFLALLQTFENAKRAYQYAIIGGFKKLWDAWDGEQVEFDWNDAWPKLVLFFDTIISENAFWSEPVIDDEPLLPTRNWIPGLISEFLRSGTRTDEKAYDPNLLPRTWQVIKILLDKSEFEHEAPEGDAYSRTINSSRGKAIEALFSHALRWCRVTDAAEGNHVNIWQEMRPVFDKEVEACQNKNFEFSALAGAYIWNLFYLDTTWTKNHFSKIFPIEFPTNFQSALDGLTFAPAVDTIYRELVDTGVVESALEHGIKDGYARDNLIQRMCLAFISGIEELDSRRFELLFQNDRLDYLMVACRYFWSIRSEPLSQEHKDNILHFWSQCVRWSQSIDPHPAELLSALSRLSCYLPEIRADELECMLAVAPHVGFNYNADFFTEELARLVEVSPLEVAKILSAMLTAYRPSFDFEDRLKKLIIKLAEKQETREYALRCANTLSYIPGMVQLYAQIFR